jgi:hypothetical protein
MLGNGEVRVLPPDRPPFLLKGDNLLDDLRRRADEDDRRRREGPRVVYRRPPTLAERYAQQKALELEIAHEHARAYLAAKQRMRQAAMRRS